MEEIIEELIGRGCRVVALPTPGAAGVAEAAAAHGIDPVELVRAELFAGIVGPVLAIGAGGGTIDLQRLRRVTGDPTLRHAGADVIASLDPNVRTGAVPALPGWRGVVTLVDPEVADRDQWVFAGGSPELLICVDRAEVTEGQRVVVTPLGGGEHDEAEPAFERPMSRSEAIEADLPPVHASG